MVSSAAATSFDHAQALVREQDRDRYLTALFAPPEHRPGLLALYAFNIEIARIRDVVNDPLPGEVRLQWWRDFLTGTHHGETSANPVAAALAETIRRYHLPVAALVALIDARVFDLYDDPMPTLTDLEGYAGETSSALIQLASIVLAGGSEAGTCDAAGHAGVAYGLTGLMRALPWHAARHQQFLPSDVLDRHGVDRATLFRGEMTPELGAALTEMRAHARHHLDRTRGLVGSVRPEVAAAFLPVCLVEPFLKVMERKGFNPFRDRAELSQLRRQWIIWRAARKAFRAG
ncbi:squalene/phytoene synthase family protein [Microvirga tunisiensis]|uniref:Squalene/phytoene synthase family protein n=2 Tax=Pannonibacter tanglangensis TaxID=2750084 RepID=A0ABW9ZDW5_9HYPH|nr:MULTISPECIES: phytoene/squalene synthase family protein [unclassified Pannonibacter]NBN62212.1 squalene/phytoene synthase family protein [Pannonibacter sp. XCT-34]NBN77880.1 squalene/phytoene synthase family protein [Pannonibacter sp. XCT-53]